MKSCILTHMKQRGFGIGSVTAVAIVAAVACFAGCSSSEGDGDAGGGTGGGGSTTSASTTGATATGAGGATSSTGASTGSLGSGGGPSTDCEGEIVPGSGEVIAVDEVAATVVDVSGAPVKKQLVQVCGLDICINGETNESGGALMAIGKDMTQPAFKVGDGLTYGKIARPIRESSPKFDAVVVPALPSSGAELVPGEDATSNGVVLSLAPETAIAMDIITYDEPEKQKFRAAPIPKDKMDPALVTDDAGPKLEVFYAFAPVDTLLCPAAALTVPNDAAWPAGTEVEIFAHGTGVDEYWAPYGGWEKVSEGRVSDDGKTISTNPGEGLPLLSAIGIRRK